MQLSFYSRCYLRWRTHVRSAQTCLAHTGICASMLTEAVTKKCATQHGSLKTESFIHIRIRIFHIIFECIFGYQIKSDSPTRGQWKRKGHGSKRCRIAYIDIKTVSDDFESNIKVVQDRRWHHSSISLCQSGHGITMDMACDKDDHSS